MNSGTWGPSLAVTEDGWRTIMEIWLIMAALLYATALTFRDGVDRTLTITAVGMPLFAAALAMLSARQTVRHSLRSHERNTWMGRTRWAFDVILNPHADGENIRTAVASLGRQLNAGEVPTEDISTVHSMIANAYRRLERLPGRTPS